ncbi:MAG: hypothetical protein GY757_59855, partial [bacterium]|nr:hypothetical protein [bacterium]
WQTVKKRILHRLEETRRTNPTDTLPKALSNLPETKTPLNYCAEMIPILLLNIERLRNRKLQPALNSLSATGQVGLGALAGISLASTLTNETDDTNLTDKLITHTQRFQNQLTEMSDESISKLSSFLKDATSLLSGPKK